VVLSVEVAALSTKGSNVAVKRCLMGGMELGSDAAT
jgi:hypothetical protein